ncbi:diguanylate cyclase [Maridesulfovibrio sp.]|uniref:GGDEF domain-containing protein n=1 Tax=Maridesulfovibrio sp. TaxID=2795000 RepID=UPI002A18B67E|nr:diguanylate cyclase [Maridesulfovibrio sp.]
MLALIDMRTMLQVGAMVCLTLALVMTYYFFARKTYQGFQHWTAGFVCVGIGAVLVSMRNLLPAFISIILGNFLIIMMPALLLYGLEVFLSLEQRQTKLNTIAIALFVSAFLWWTYISPSVHFRIICISILMALLFAQSFYISIKYIPSTLGKQEWLFVATLGISTISSAFRATITILSIGNVKFINNTNILQSTALLLIILSVTACACSILILNSYRMENDLKKARDRIEGLVNIDDLCKIYNRRFFNKKLVQEFTRHQRTSTPLSLLMLDIDCFKLYNDTYGHLAGDQCLTQVASVLNMSVGRSSDITARYGGEEFVVLLPNTETKGAQNVAETIQKGLKHAAIPHKASTVANTITLSIGIATIIPERSTSPNLLIKHADHSLYIGKNNGKNQIQIYTDT